MTAYSCTPNDGMNQLWITSVLVTSTRMLVPTGTHQRIVDVEQPRLPRLQIGVSG